MNTLPEASFEPVCIQQPHKELKIRLLAVVGRSRHQQEVPGHPASQCAELEPFGVLDFLAEEAGRHSVRFVADDEIPLRGRFELGLQLLIPGKHVEPRDQPGAVHERISGLGCLDLLPAQDIETQAELF